MFNNFVSLVDVLPEVEEEPDADELIAAALGEARGQEGTYPNPHRPGPIDPQVHVSQCTMRETTVAARDLEGREHRDFPAPDIDFLNFKSIHGEYMLLKYWKLSDFPLLKNKPLNTIPCMYHSVWIFSL